ncbi:MAG: RNase adapter RapZ [Pseudomonadota bacterium]
MNDQGQPGPKLLIVTGMSGAGKSTALKIFEDLGYEAVDNLPISLVRRLLNVHDDNPDHQENRPIAVGIDSRTRAFHTPTILKAIKALRKDSSLDVELVFFDCGDEHLKKRFSETRRRHPLAADRPIGDGIAHERERMAALKETADWVIDTSNRTIHDLKRKLTTNFGSQAANAMTLTVMSFGFARGIAREADLVFDVRFLSNPHYDPDLRPLTGRDERVAGFVSRDASFTPMFDRMSDLVFELIPRYRAEGKAYLTISFGCTGGRHRSVFCAELLHRMLMERGYPNTIVHRDCNAEPIEQS